MPTMTYTSNLSGVEINNITNSTPTFVSYNQDSDVIGEDPMSASVYYRSFLKFDLTKGTNIPGTLVTILAARLKITFGGGFPGTVQVNTYRVLRDIVMSQATWNVWKTGSNWTTAGCGGAGTDFENTNQCSISVDVNGGLLTGNFPIALAQGWLNGSIANYGLLLKLSSELNQYTYVRFYNNVYPVLEIDYSHWDQLRHCWIN